MLSRGTRLRRALDRGFVLSDPADWPGLMYAIEATGATRVIVTPAHVDIIVRWLLEGGLDASAFSTEYDADEDDNVAVNEAMAFKESHAGICAPLQGAGHTNRNLPQARRLKKIFRRQ
jgi:putative mRNA 3-end processing factor